MIEKNVEFLKELSIEKLLLVELQETQNKLCEVKIEKQILRKKIIDLRSKLNEKIKENYKLKENNMCREMICGDNE